MSNKKITDLPILPSSALAQSSGSYYTIVEKEDGSLYKMLIKDALEVSESIDSIRFLDKESVIFYAGPEVGASPNKAIPIDVNLQKYGVPSYASTAIVTTFMIGGFYPRFDVSLGNKNQVRIYRKSARAMDWCYQVMVPIESSRLKGSLTQKNSNQDVKFEIRLHGYG